jgi:hypothetical protein
VQVRDQSAPSSVEDAQSSLKVGDVIAIFPAGHQWSETEKISYLLIKLRISEKEMQELTQPQTTEAKAPAGPDGSDQPMEQQIVRARMYRLKTETLKINPDNLYKGQPYESKIFSSSLIEKKKSL